MDDIVESLPEENIWWHELSIVFCMDRCKFEELGQYHDAFKWRYVKWILLRLSSSAVTKLTSI